MVPDVFWISGFVVFSIRDNHLLPCFLKLSNARKMVKINCLSFCVFSFVTLLVCFLALSLLLEESDLC